MGTNYGERSSGNGANLTPTIPLNNKGETDKLYVELWLACAGPNAHIPRVGDKVYYFPQGHAEQVQALCAHEGVKVDVPIYNLPSKILCKVVHIQLKAEANTDEVYAEITLLPYNKKGVPIMGDDDVVPFYQANNVFSFSKILTPSDTSTHGGFSVPKRYADDCFPRLDMSLQPPVQELVAKDVNGFKWHFRHIYRGQPKRHLLTSGWSTFVSSKKLVPGDSCIFLRGEDGELRVGVRHTTKRCTPSNSTTSVIPENSMHHGIFASASHAIITGCMFILYNRPWTGPANFIIPYDKYMESAGKEYVPGMRFRLGFESKECVEKRHMGTIIDVEDYDTIRWPNSKWRCLKVQWDGGSDMPSLPERLSPWEIKLIPADRTDVFVQPLPKRGRGIDLLLPGCPGMVKKGLLLNQRQKEVLQGQEISDVCSDEPGAKIPNIMPQLTLPPPSPDWKPKQLLQFPIYPSPGLLEATVSTGLSNPWSSVSSTLGNSSNSMSQDCVEQRSATDDEASRRQPSGCDKYMLFGFNLFSTHPELPSLNGEVLNSHSARPISQPSGSKLLLAMETPKSFSGLVSEKQCKQCSSFSTRSCIKVLKYGTTLGRSVDLSQFRGYKELISELDQMFEFNGSLIDESSGWKLTYMDDEGDLMLVGDYEWQAFRVAARKIFICPKEEINKMKPESLKSGIFQVMTEREEFISKT